MGVQGVYFMRGGSIAGAHTSVRRFGSLRFRLLALVALALLPALGLIVYTASERRRQATIEAEHNALQLARLASIDHELRVEGARELLSGLARLPEVRQQDSTACTAVFAELLNQYPHYANLGAIDLNGDPFCSALPLSRPVNLADRTYFRRAVETREFAVGEYQVGRITGVRSVNFGYPVVDSTGRVRAVVFAALDLAWLNRLGVEAHLPQGSSLTVVDGNGTVLARSPDPEHWVGKVSADAVVTRTILAQHEGVMRARGLDGIPRLFGFTPLRGVTRAGRVYMSIGIPEAIAFGAINRALARNVSALALVGVLTLAAAWLGGDLFILRRARALLDATKRLGAGDLGARSGVRYGAGELDELARTFDEMAESLGRRTADLQEAEGKYRALVEQSLVGVYVIRGERVLYINQAGADIFGYRPDEIVGRLRPLDLVHPEDRPLVASNIAARLSGKVEAIRYSARGLRKDGATTYWEVFGRRILYGGEPAILGTLIDITERKRAEEELRRVNRGLRVLSAGNQALVRARDEPDLLHLMCQTLVNVGGYRLAWVGFAEEDAGKTVRPVAQAGYDEGYLESLSLSWAETERGRGPIGTAIRSRTPYVVQNILTDPAFAPWRAEAVRRGYASAMALPLIAEDRIFGALAIYAAEADAFNTEELSVLTELADDLAYGIAARRAHAERIRAEEELERQREARYQSEKLATMGQLLAGVAHELNNPLSIVKGQADLLLSQACGGPLAARAGKIGQAAGRSVRIVKNFLALAREQPPERQRGDLNQIVREAVELLAYQLRVDTVEVTLELALGLPSLWVDPHQVHQVVVNLISNAHQAMRQSPLPRRLTLTTGYAASNGRVHLTVADTGPGIPPEIQAKIFEPFFTTKPAGEGTGLGLSLSQGIIEEHGGSIGVESQPGHGAVFRLELPVEAARVAMREAGVVEPPTPTQAKAKAILVVDDEPGIAEMLGEILMADGHEVEMAANGAIALDKLREHPYDLILTDIRMPQLDGFGLYRELAREYPELLKRVVFLTGAMPSQEIREFLEKTGAPSVSKPFAVEDLRKVTQQA